MIAKNTQQSPLSITKQIKEQPKRKKEKNIPRTHQESTGHILPYLLDLSSSLLYNQPKLCLYLCVCVCVCVYASIHMCVHVWVPKTVNRSELWGVCVWLWVGGGEMHVCVRTCVCVCVC